MPNSQNTHSPQLSIGSNDMWVPGSSQAHNDVVLSQGSSQSVFHRSSQVSFSDSLTDDSEVINEFDLNFETEANEESSSKVIFQAFIEELLRDVDETDSKDKVFTPVFVLRFTLLFNIFVSFAGGIRQI